MEQILYKQFLSTICLLINSPYSSRIRYLNVGKKLWSIQVHTNSRRFSNHLKHMGENDALQLSSITTDNSI